MLAPLPALDSRVDQLLCEHIKDIRAPSPEEVHRLVYEIELRESQLEQQNEELRKIQQHLEAYKDRYVDLYDFAPLGYGTLDGDGYLQEINLAGAKMLGAERLENTAENLTNWLRQPNIVKPGCNMPNLNLAGGDLTALTAYLESLR